MKEKRAVIIYNPCSGLKQFNQSLGRVVEKLSQHKYIVEVYPTKQRGDAITAGERACEEGVDTVIAAGGDGTLNEVINGIVKYKSRPKIGHIPAGTTNDVASTLKIPKNIEQAIDIILAGEVAKMDIGRLNETCFTYIAAIGAFTELTYTTPSKLKAVIGRLAYIFHMVWEIPNAFSPFKLKVTTEERSVEGEYVTALFINGRDFAGLKRVIPHAKLNDNKFDVLLIPKSSLKVITGVARGVVLGLDKKLSDFGIVYLQGNRFSIESDRKMIWNTDGEKSGSSSSASIECLHKKIDFIVPKKTKEELF